MNHTLFLALYTLMVIATTCTTAITIFEIVIARDLRKMARLNSDHDCTTPGGCPADEVLDKVRGEYAHMRTRAILSVAVTAFGLFAIALAFGRLA